MKKRILGIALALVLALTLMPAMAFAADTWNGSADITWYTGHEDDTSYTIDTAAELAGLAELVNGGTTTFSGKTITLGDDIDLNNQEWTPIGDKLGYSGFKYFNGTFDGQNHSISGLRITTVPSDKDYTYSAYGLFASAGAGAEFKNLTIISPYINLDQAKNVGALLGGVCYAGNKEAVTITNIHVTDAKLTANARVGGIVGWVIDSTKGVAISDCSVTGSISAVYNKTASDDGDKAGGIVGQVSSASSIINCSYSDGTVRAYREAAGIVGTYAGGDQVLTGCEVADVKVEQDTTSGTYSDPLCGQLAGRVTETSVTISAAANDFSDNVAVIADNTPTADGIGTTNATVKTSFAAIIGSTSYDTLADAIEAANQAGGTDPVTITITKSGDYDLAQITRANVTIEAATGVTATFTVSSTVKNQFNAANITLKNLNFISRNGATIVSFGNCDNLTLEKCTFTGDGTGTALFTHQPNITIRDCAFKDFAYAYDTCGDNYAAGKITITGNTFNNIRVPINGYWGMKATDDTSITITGNTFNAGDWDAAYIQLWDYAQYLNWLKDGSVEDSRKGSAINATIKDNTYIGDVVIYATHFDWLYDSDLTLDNESQQLLKYRVLVELENAVSATVTNADGSEITAFNESTASSNRGGKTVIYSLSEGEYLFDIKPTGSTGDGLVTKTVTVKPTTADASGSNTNKVTVTAGQQIEVAKVGNQKYPSLAQAIEAAMTGNDKTVTLLANISIDTWNQVWNIDGLTINGNDHTITIGKVESNVNGNYLTYAAKNLNVSNLTIKFETNGNGFDMVSGKLENVRLYGGTGSYGVFVSASDAADAKVEIESCLFDGFDMAIYSQPCREEGKKTSDITVNETSFTNCDNTMCIYSQNIVFTNNTVTGGGEISFAAGAEHASAARENSITVTGNSFQDAGKIWFYGADLAAVEFTENKVLGNTVVSTQDAKADTKLDVSENYWGGNAPTGSQVSGSNVSGGDVYYVSESMNRLNTDKTSSPSYKVTVSKTAGGSVTATPTSASKGLTITVKVKADEGYTFDELTVTDASGNELKLNKRSDTEYSFSMPGSAVTVKATFVNEDGEVESGLPFDDVDVDDWFYDAVVYAYENELMNGVADDEFAPNATLTRGMMATLLYRLEGEPDVTGVAFDDIGTDMWYTDAITWAAANEIVNGYGDGVFAPNDAITREQLAAILYRYAAYKDYGVDHSETTEHFTDAESISEYAIGPMNWAVGAGLMNGVTDTTLQPQGTATRAQVATMLMRFIEAF